LNLKVDKIGFSIEVDDALLDSLVGVGKSHYPNEFGGFLIGYYGEDNKHLYITDTVLPKSFKASKCSFERSTKGIEKKLGEYYKESPQKFYVGEWHTHPDNSPYPSSADIMALNAIKNDKDAGLANPVLLIIGYSTKLVNLGFYIFFDNNIYKYEKQRSENCNFGNLFNRAL